MGATEQNQLRELLGEEIPTSGAEADTLFTSAQLQVYLDEAEDNLDRAALRGWRVKAAKLSNLVDTTEGNSSKKFSQLLDHALEMQKLYLRSSEGSTEGRTRVGRIKRAGVEW